ncbi:MAG: glycosyltransferase [Bryobacteraceae bacterium]
MIRVSVIIPTRDRPGPLAACLRALAVSYPADAETIVISDGGSEDLGPVVKPFLDSLRLQLLQVEAGGPSAARNHGLLVARGSIVLFTDDDCRPLPGWVNALAGGVSLSPPIAVGGATNNGLPANAYADTAQLVLCLLARHDLAVIKRERLLASNNLAFPAETLRQIGGFDERFRTAEDRELCRRWAAAGYSLGRVLEAVVEHDDRLTLSGFVLKFFAYGRGAARFHGSGVPSSLRGSLGFHFRLPVLVLPELRRRGFGRGMAVAALLVMWEIANTAGYLAERVGLPASRTEPAREAALAKVVR